jgi:YD repeat-containing protein
MLALQLYTNAVSRSIASTDPTNRKWTSIYDPAGRMTASQNPLDYRTSYSYDPNGNHIHKERPKNLVYDANATRRDVQGRNRFTV